MRCPNCKEWVEDIEIEVEAEAEWDNFSDDSDNDRMPSSNGFSSCDIHVIWPEFDNYPWKWLWDNSAILEEVHSLRNKSLLIIVKTTSIHGFCYLGLSVEDGKIYRPIYR